MTHMSCVDDRFPTECVGGSLCVVGLEPGAQQGKFDGTTTTAGARLCTGPIARTCTCQQQLECRGEEKRETWSSGLSIGTPSCFHDPCFHRLVGTQCIQHWAFHNHLDIVSVKGWKPKSQKLSVLVGYARHGHRPVSGVRGMALRRRPGGRP